MNKGKTMILFAIIAGYAIRFLSLFNWRERHPAISYGAAHAKTSPAPAPHLASYANALAERVQKQKEMNVAQNQPPIKLNQWNRCSSV